MIKRSIEFDPTIHQYTDEDKNIYTSVTTLIGKYHPKFDESYWAKFKAEQLGTTPEIIKENWKQIREFSQEKGTKEHNLLEDSINQATHKSVSNYHKNNIINLLTNLNIVITSTNLEVLKNTPLAKKYPKIYKYLEAKILDGWSLYAEKRVYWYEYLVAGTIDCLLIKGKTFIIVDWKTNKDHLKFKSGYYKKVNGIKTDIWVDKKEYFFKPIQHIEHCKGNIYTLQLSLYAYLLELWGFKCIDLILFHIMEDLEPIDYKITYRYSDCQILLIDNKNVSTKSKTNNSTESFGIT